jgi:TolB-like protein/Flp pilus assembly protein TadD
VGVELRHLRYFVAVAEEAHLGRAAKRLNLSGPALSVQIHDLERDVGVSLFDRTPRGMQLTAAGVEFLAHAHTTLRAADSGALAARRVHESPLSDDNVQHVVVADATDAARPSTRRVPLAWVAAAAFTVLLTLATIIAFARHSPPEASVVRLAVLPFDNVLLPLDDRGDTANAYFADGMTDAVRGKLGSIGALEIIASASSNQYRHTAESLDQVGRELGAQYLLIGRVRLIKRVDGQSRVRVDPELVQVSGVPRPIMRWEQSFDADLSDVFQVQADIATHVAQALRVVLTPTTSRTLAQRPTDDMDAYDAYLRGQAIERQQGSSAALLRRAAEMYTNAVRRDSTFALAWAALSEADAKIYSIGAAAAIDADASRRAAASALDLAPELPEAHVALGTYYNVVERDNTRALTELQAALQLAPPDARVLQRIGLVERDLGRWREALLHHEEAARLDPRDAATARALGLEYLWLRRYPASIAALNRAIALEPASLDNIQFRALAALAQGDLEGARRIVHDAPPLDATAFIAYFATFIDLVWFLDTGQRQRLITLSAGAFDGDRAAWALALCQVYALNGDRARVQAYADTAQAAFANEMRTASREPALRAMRGVALAYLGRRPEAIAEAKRAVVLGQRSGYAFESPYYRHQLVRTYLILGETDKALDEIEALLDIPYVLAPGWLRIDPTFDPLRGNPRFERLIARQPVSW